MKKNKLLVLMFLIYIMIYSSTAQTQFTYPMKPGDIRVYVDSTGLYRNTFLIATSISIDTIKSGDTSRYFGVGVLLAGNTTYFLNSFAGRNIFCIDSNHILITGHPYSTGIQELFPLDPYQSDSGSLHRYDIGTMKVYDTTKYHIVRRFDTTIFQQHVNAYMMLCLHGQDTSLWTVADQFGIIKIVKTSHSYPQIEYMILSSAVLDGKKYNRDNRTQKIMKLCPDNIYQYSRYSKPTGSPATTDYITSTIVGDTVISGHQYFIRGFDFGFSYLRVLREGDDGLYTYLGKDSLLFPDDISIGTPIMRSFIITDTSTFIDSLNNSRRMFRTSTVGFFSCSWVPPFGIVHWSDNGSMIYVEDGFLQYARICGQGFGTLVNVEKETPIIQSSYLSQNYPNPFSTSTSIRYRLSSLGHVRLEVFDLLGRKINTLVDEEKDAGEYTTTFPPRTSNLELHSGIYFYRLSVGNYFQTKKMIVIQ